MSPLVAPDVEGLVVAWLKQALVENGETVQVTRSVPVNRPTRFVTVSQVGGARRQRVIGYGMVVVQCWDAPTKRGDVIRLANLCEGLIHSMEQVDLGGVWVRSVTGSGSGVAYYPDPLSDASRAQFTAELNVKLQPA